MTPAETRFWDRAKSLKENQDRLLSDEIIAKMMEDFRQIIEEQERGTERTD